MKDEISEEAKKAIADAARRKAADRLNRDGAYSLDAIRRRVRAIAQERGLQPAEFAKLDAQAQQAETVEAQRQEIVRLFLALPARLQPTALAGIRDRGKEPIQWLKHRK